MHSCHGNFISCTQGVMVKRAVSNDAVRSERHGDAYFITTYAKYSFNQSHLVRRTSPCNAASASVLGLCTRFACVTYGKKGHQLFHTTIVAALATPVKEATDTTSKQSPSLTLTCNKSTLSPSFVTGFTDAEGSFMVSISKTSESRHGFRIRPIFQIELHQKDLELLNNIQAYFGGIGFITKAVRNSLAFRVRSLEDLQVVIAHFEAFPLKTQKAADLELFKRAVSKLIAKEHLKFKGLQEIVNIRASLNLGLTDSLRVAFPETIPVPRTLVKDLEVTDPE